jgi:hypothetical protein
MEMSSTTITVDERESMAREAERLKEKTLTIQQAKMETYLELVGRGLPVPTDLLEEMQLQAPGEPVELREGDILHIKMGIMDMGGGLPPWIPGSDEMAGTRGLWQSIVPEGVKVVVSHFGVDTQVIPVQENETEVEFTSKVARFGCASSASTKYPYEEGDLLVLGPQVIADPELGVVNWRGENYVALETLMFRLPPEARKEVEKVMQSQVIND